MTEIFEKFYNKLRQENSPLASIIAYIKDEDGHIEGWSEDDYKTNLDNFLRSEDFFKTKTTYLLFALYFTVDYNTTNIFWELLLALPPHLKGRVVKKLVDERMEDGNTILHAVANINALYAGFFNIYQEDVSNHDDPGQWVCDFFTKLTEIVPGHHMEELANQVNQEGELPLNYALQNITEADFDRFDATIVSALLKFTQVEADISARTLAFIIADFEKARDPDLKQVIRRVNCRLTKEKRAEVNTFLKDDGIAAQLPELPVLRHRPNGPFARVERGGPQRAEREEEANAVVRRAFQ